LIIGKRNANSLYHIPIEVKLSKSHSLDLRIAVIPQSSESQDACPNWNVDLSWDLVQSYMVDPKPGMPTLDDWANFISKYQDRVLWGSDTVIYTRNKIDDKGNLILGKEMSVEDYLAVKDILQPLWEKVGPQIAHKVKYANHVRLFDAARMKVRAWEAAHATDNVWNLTVSMQ